MKAIKLLALATATFILFGCKDKAPDIQKVQDATESSVEQLLTEDNNEQIYLRMDRYFLSEQTNPLTYEGYLKATAFFHIFPTRTDSLKVYKKVVIKFQDKDYDAYSILITKYE